MDMDQVAKPMPDYGTKPAKNNCGGVVWFLLGLLVVAVVLLFVGSACSGGSSAPSGGTDSAVAQRLARSNHELAKEVNRLRKAQPVRIEAPKAAEAEKWGHPIRDRDIQDRGRMGVALGEGEYPGAVSDGPDPRGLFPDEDYSKPESAMDARAKTATFRNFEAFHGLQGRDGFMQQELDSHAKSFHQGRIIGNPEPFRQAMQGIREQFKNMEDPIGYLDNSMMPVSDYMYMNLVDEAKEQGLETGESTYGMSAPTANEMLEQYGRLKSGDKSSVLTAAERKSAMAKVQKEIDRDDASKAAADIADVRHGLLELRRGMVLHALRPDQMDAIAKWTYSDNKALHEAAKQLYEDSKLPLPAAYDF